MKPNENPENMPIIEKLIAAEEEAGLRKFREHDFRARLKACLLAEEKSRGPSSLWRKIRVAAWTGTGLLVVAGVIVLFVLISRPPRTSPIRIIENFLMQTPGARTLRDHTAAGLNETEALQSPFESVIFKSLGSSPKGPADGPPEKSKATPLSALPKIRHLGLEKTYEILIQEKAIERVLSLCLKKYEEV